MKIIKKKLKGALGETHFKNNESLKKRSVAKKIYIDVKKHNGNKKELASTIKHELLHAKHPRMTEKEVTKRTRQKTISQKQMKTLLKKLK